MKSILIPLVAIALASCSHKDGDPASNKKIETIIASSAGSEDGQPIFDFAPQQVQSWHWDGDELYRIDFSEDHDTYSENLYYDNRNRLTHTTIPARKLRSRFTYDGRQLAQIEILQNEEPLFTLSFTHSKGKITHAVKTTADGTTSVEYNLIWDGENVARMETTENGATSTTTYTYDDKRNPMRDIYSLFMLQQGLDPAMLSRNNITSSTGPFRDIDGFTFNYIYEYEGRYPSQRKVTYSYTSMNHETYQPSLVTMSETRQYHYQK